MMFNIGDEVVYTFESYPNWIGTRGIVKEILHERVVLEVTETTYGSREYKNKLITLFHYKLTPLHKEYDPSQQKDSDDDL